MTVDLTRSHEPEYPQLPGSEKNTLLRNIVLIAFLPMVFVLTGIGLYFLNTKKFIYETKFRDEFRNNENGWQTENSDRLFIQVDAKNQRYIVAPSLRISSWLTWQHLPELDLKKDIFVEAEFQTTGTNQKGYGIYFFGNQTQSFWQFLMSESGYCAIFEYKQGRYTAHTDWKRFSALRKKGPNRLRVEKIKNSLKFYVNGKLFRSLYEPDASGSYFGFVVHGGDRLLANQFMLGYILEKSQWELLLEEL